ncbi:hypothetical protein Sjap_024528 [Stephania japonica]|uniref:Uncharacterized protein n=1 Tax=Stephania japonica TaxID=461633 RepID=A0AAP0HP17_9MAGN
MFVNCLPNLSPDLVDALAFSGRMWTLAVIQLSNSRSSMPRSTVQQGEGSTTRIYHLRIQEQFFPLV